MITEDEFLRLLRMPEGDTLDFKQTLYDLSRDDDKGKADLIKDVLCMANTPREEAAHIVLGIAKHPDGTFDMIGLPQVPDSEQIISQFSSARVYPIPELAFDAVQVEGKLYAVVTILAKRIGPCLPLKDFPAGTSFLRERQVYFRRGSKNDVAMPEDLRRILHWILQEPIQKDPGIPTTTPAWEQFIQAVHDFEAHRKYILVAGPVSPVDAPSMASLGLIPWSGVIDFDPNSELNGLLATAGPVISSRRNLLLSVYGDRLAFNSSRGTQWFFARGLQGRQTTIENGTFKDYVSHYKNELHAQIGRLAAEVNPAPVTIVALWLDRPLDSKYLRTTLESLLAAFGNAADFVVVSHQPSDHLAAIADESDATVISIPPQQLGAGIEWRFSQSATLSQEQFALPSSSRAPIPIPDRTQKALAEEIDLVHLGIGLTPPANREIGRDFLRGHEITWYELGLHEDVDRDKREPLQRRIDLDLQSKRAVRVNLYHAPGAGGTTLARRLLWEFHTTYPSGLLLRTTPPDTAERLYTLASLTGQSVLLLIDGADISERQVDELFDQVKSRQIPTVILQTLRRFKSQQEGERAFYLKAPLSPKEASWFHSKFVREAPQRKANLDQLVSAQDPKTCTAFYFGLESFGSDFRGLESYVALRLADLTDIQRKMLVYFGLAYHYAQKPLPAQAFAGLLGTSPSRPVSLANILSDGICDLMVVENGGEWRPAHDLIASEMLEQLLWPYASDRRNWKQNLSMWAKEFADFCRGTSPIPSEAMTEIVRRTFIYRDNADLLGTERSAQRTFAQLIDDIPSREGKLDLLRRLVELYPEEAHLWAHLGRFYSIEMRDYNKAVESIENAIELQPRDHVLHHMRGMALRSQIYELCNERTQLSDIIQSAALASEAFATARSLNPDDEHGYISEVQMLARVLDYAGKAHPGGVLEYLKSPTAHAYLRDALERAEDLLEIVRRNREGEGSSSYEEECRGKIDALYGRHGAALETFTNMLGRKDVYKPALRRQIVWTYLARRDRSWDGLEAKEVERVVNLLQENLQEEPNNEKDIRLWVQAVRRQVNPPSIESIIERVGYWRASSGSLDASYYLYVLHTLLSLEGSALAIDEATRFLQECSQMARFRRNRTKSLEWMGFGIGVGQLVHHSELGEWLGFRDFWEADQKLRRLEGRIARIEGPQSGRIEVQNSLDAFYVPARAGGAGKEHLNRRVQFFLGFSYDGLRAWEVKEIA